MEKEKQTKLKIYAIGENGDGRSVLIQEAEIGESFEIYPQLFADDVIFAIEYD